MDVKLMMRWGLAAGTLLAFTSCISLPTDPAPTSTARQYTFQDTSTTPSTNIKFDLNTNNNTYSAINNNRVYTFSGTYTRLTNGLIQFNRTASSNPTNYPVGGVQFGVEAPDMALLLVNTTDIKGMDPFMGTAAVTFELGYAQGGACPAATTSYNVLTLSGASLAGATTIPDVYGTATLTGPTNNQVLSGQLWPLGSDAKAPSTALVVNPGTMGCAQGLLKNLADEIILTRTGAGAASLATGSAYTLFPRPATTANPVVAGAVYTGVMQMPYFDAAAIPTAVWRLNQIFIQATATANGTLTLSKLDINPTTNAVTQAASPVASVLVDKSTAAIPGLWDASWISLPGAAAFVNPARLLSTPVNGKTMIAGFFQFDTSVPANGIVDPSDWGFLMLYQN